MKKFIFFLFAMLFLSGCNNSHFEYKYNKNLSSSFIFYEIEITDKNYDFIEMKGIKYFPDNNQINFKINSLELKEGENLIPVKIKEKSFFKNTSYKYIKIEKKIEKIKYDINTKLYLDKDNKLTVNLFIDSTIPIKLESINNKAKDKSSNFFHKKIETKFIDKLIFNKLRDSYNLNIPYSFKTAEGVIISDIYKEKIDLIPYASLIFTSPKDSTINQKKEVLFEGKVSNGASLFLNDKEIVLKNNKFSFTTTLEELSKQFNFKVSHKNMKSLIKTIKITRNLTNEEIRIKKEKKEAELKKLELEREKEAELKRKNQERDYKNSSEKIQYKLLKKNPYAKINKVTYFKGKILQAGSDSGVDWFIISTKNQGYGYWTDNVFVIYDGTTDFLSDNIVRVWGEVVGPHNYESQAGYNLSIPLLNAKYISW